ncbi:MAG: hypothetical protein ACW98K_04995 [Candidatus Kariarchaeaceae archaeon]|jgi:hypothetical protein
MSINYADAASIITSKRITLLKNYYSTWSGNYTVDLKFRLIKIFGVDLVQNSSRWISLHRFVNKRRLDNQNLPSLLLKLIDQQFIPIRVFQSVSEWLAPNEVHHLRMIRSNIFPIENDDSLSKSIACAKEVAETLAGEKLYVFSGNKSIHVWWINFEFEHFLTSPLQESLGTTNQSEKFNRIARSKAFKDIQQKITHKLDRRISEDTRRVIPIIGTVNAFTGKTVLQMDYETLMNITPSELLLKSSLNGWE